MSVLCPRYEQPTTKGIQEDNIGSKMLQVSRSQRFVDVDNYYFFFFTCPVDGVE